MEARVHGLHPMNRKKLEELGGGVVAGVEVLCVNASEDFIKGDNHIDPTKWSPLTYNFRHYFRLAECELGKTFRAGLFPVNRASVKIQRLNPCETLRERL